MSQQGVSLQSNRTADAPDLAELHRLLSQALGRRGQHIQRVWRSSDRSASFVLDVFGSEETSDPKWRLYRESPSGRQLLFDYPSCDVLLIHNSIVTSCGQTAARTSMGLSKSAIVPDTPPPSAGEPEIAKTPAEEDEHARGITGELADTSLDRLLERLRSEKSTGRLELRKDHHTALLFVKEGIPVDATASDAEGDDAMVELLTWKSGSFSFEPRVLRNSHTVHQTLESLLAQSKQLGERTDYLTKAGMSAGSVVVARDTNCSDGEFAQKAYRGAPMALPELTRFYRSLDGKTTIEEMAHSAQMSRVQLINVIYHLVINGLAKISVPIVLQKKNTMQPRAIETAAIQGVMMSLRRLETGMFIYPAFLYFLEQEYFRCYRSKTPLSVIVFEMRCKNDSAERESLPSAAVLDAVLRISQLKRHVDLLAHYDSMDYALLLPNTKANGAQIFAKRIVKSLTDSPLAGDISSSDLSLAVGVASMPEDFSELGELLGAADMAMAQSRDTKKPVIMYRDIKPITL
ncbi:MAG TPA: DUF4388 domain-containing protein [Planktothrix sp.]|jgi:hypothetical protein